MSDKLANSIIAPENLVFETRDLETTQEKMLGALNVFQALLSWIKVGSHDEEEMLNAAKNLALHELEHSLADVEAGKFEVYAKDELTKTTLNAGYRPNRSRSQDQWKRILSAPTKLSRGDEDALKKLKK